MTTRFVLLGGFLGAGKTTLISQLAHRYVAAGKRVGIVTNDQAADLVDTQNLRGQGFDVGEVAGACFCCSFNNLVETAASLSKDQTPDIILAEPVGSCTDLVATVLLPLQQMYGDDFQLAPFGVLLKPSHGMRILDPEAGRSGFSPDAEYIFRKQLDEADYLMIGRSDQLTAEQLENCKQLLSAAAPDVPLLAVSPKTGEGVEQVMGYIESPLTAGRRVLSIDYQRYAVGEAEMGWVNLSAAASGEGEFDLDRISQTLVADIAQQIESSEGEIAHLKVSVGASGRNAVANVVSTGGGVDVGLQAGRLAKAPIEIIVNARVAMDPAILETICTAATHRVAQSHALELTNCTAHALRPGAPQPTHRVTT
ncbi:GTP-binding protein [Roseimaritima ulvae]|uniref:Putative GTP-binding protein YjiA n=1 Tax=Roseimaritima ulvae TaxID=980254 RepID=A0A5B9QWB0_9BACT|nr:GTP-binding protein [Roseimaritima ulvae]QEG41386.1 putative GTP-binding protein YjiA [Roseimaritima ulvae]